MNSGGRGRVKRGGCPRPTAWSEGPKPSAHRRPGYPSVGCAPAEPASVSPGKEKIARGAQEARQRQAGNIRRRSAAGKRERGLRSGGIGKRPQVLRVVRSER